MNRKHTRLLLFLALTALLGLLITQIYWFRQAFDIKQGLKEQQINLALRAVGHELLQQEGDTLSLVPPVEVKDGGEFYLPLQIDFNYDTLPATVKAVFEEHRIEGSYFVALESCASKKVVLGYTWSSFGGNGVPCGGRTRTESCYNISVTFSDQSTHLLGEMGIWIFSSIAFFFVLAYFAYSLYLMLKEKRLATIRRDFINNMTHELKTPITNIGIASEQLKKESVQMTSDKRLHYAAIIHRENQRLEQQVERVLQMAMMENKAIDLQRKKIDVHQLIRDIKKDFEVRLHQHHGQIGLQLNAVEAVVEADQFHLTNVIYSLLDNAQKYARETPDIRIETETVADKIRISVVDNGIGINPKEQERIFEKFYRVSSGDVHSTKGFGLGLSYVRMIIEAHGGTVAVQSQQRQGSIFWFTL